MNNLLKNNLSHFLKQHGCLLFILLTGSILRFYDFFSIPYTHDELSALVRTNYNSFSDVVIKGVRDIDTHPPLIQVFLYYWTKCVGYHEWIVKLPFIACGIASIYLAYKIGLRWSSKTAGLLIAAIIAYSEFTLFYSQIIRPYSSGLFFMLLATYHWSELVFYQSRKWKDSIYFVLGVLLCAYNHHFSMFSATLLGVGGLFLVGRKNFFLYLSLCISALLLYLPVLPITLHQFSQGGIGNWLSPPNSYFLRNFLYYVTNLSFINVLCICSIGILFIFFGTKTNRNKKALIFSGILFAVVFMTSYIYSITISSVLQYSVLIFSFPFLLFFLFGWVRNQSELFNSVSVVILFISFTSALVIHRKYYSLNYISIFKQLVIDADSADKESNNTLFLIYVDEPKVRLYEKHLHLPISSDYIFVNGNEFDEQMIDSILKLKQVDHVFYAGTLGADPTCRNYLLSQFPQIVWQKNYCGASSLLIRKGKPSDQPIASITKNSDLFNGFNPSKWTDRGYNIENGEEWSTGYGDFITQFTKRKIDIIDVVVTLKLSDFNQLPFLVLTCQTNDSVYRYQSSSINKYEINKSDSTVTLYQSIQFVNFDFNRDSNIFLNTFIWNTDKKALKITQFDIYGRKDNPLTRTLTNRFDH